MLGFFLTWCISDVVSCGFISAGKQGNWATVWITPPDKSNFSLEFILNYLKFGCLLLWEKRGTTAEVWPFIGVEGKGNPG